MNTRYLNTDLEIESERDLSKIVDEFGEDVLVLHKGKIRGYQHAAFEIGGSSFSTSADDIINYFCDLVDALSPEAREVWDGCSRVFDNGYESGTSSPNFHSEIRAVTIERVAGIGASIVITIYPLRTERAAEDGKS